MNGFILLVFCILYSKFCILHSTFYILYSTFYFLLSTRRQVDMITRGM